MRFEIQSAMKINVVLLLIMLALFACKKEKWEPEGPTDVRIRNLQANEIMYNVVINTAGVRDTVGNIKNLGVVKPGELSDYKRVSIAFPKAEITVEINGLTFSTGPVNSTYMNYIGLMRITYEVSVADMANRTLTVNNVIPEEALIP